MSFELKSMLFKKRLCGFEIRDDYWSRKSEHA